MSNERASIEKRLIRSRPDTLLLISVAILFLLLLLPMFLVNKSQKANGNYTVTLFLLPVFAVRRLHTESEV